MRTVRVFQVDAFTDTAFAGNPAGVVLDAQQLTDEEMQRIARELNNGDTAFVLPATTDGEDVHVRFFTPRKEAPFVGHATLAAHAVLNAHEARPVRHQGGRTGVVDVRTTGDGAIAIRQSAPPLGRTPGHGEVDDVLALLDLKRADLDPATPPRIAGNASTRLLLGLRDTKALDAARPQQAALAALSARIGAQGYFLFVRGNGGQHTTESRMFCPALGIDEDPVSGNAHAMLGVHLRELGLLTSVGRNPVRFTGMQGRHVGRPGRVEVEVELGADGSATAATIAGRAVILFEAALRLA